MLEHIRNYQDTMKVLDAREAVIKPQKYPTLGTLLNPRPDIGKCRVLRFYVVF